MRVLNAYFELVPAARKRYVSGQAFLFKKLFTLSPLQALELCNRNFRTPCINEQSVPQRGQTKKLTMKDGRFILEVVETNPRISEPKLASDLLHSVIRKARYNDRASRKKNL